MKKLLISFYSLSLLLTLSACGTKEKELQSTIDIQSKEVETYYDSFINHTQRVKEIMERENRPVLTSKGHKIYNQDGNIFTERQRQEIINNGDGDPVIQVETSEIQIEWAKEHGLLDE